MLTIQRLRSEKTNQNSRMSTTLWAIWDNSRAPRQMRPRHGANPASNLAPPPDYPACGNHENESR